MRKLLCILSGLALAVLLGTPAFAIPAVNAPPDDTYMVDGQVRGLGRVGSTIWLGGSFSNVLDRDGDVAYASQSLAAFTVEGVGQDIAPDVDGFVYDIWVQGTTVYIAGEFSRVGGQPRQNLAAVNGTNGSVLPFSVSAPKLKGVAATDSVVYAAGPKLKAYDTAGSGSPLAGWVAPKAIIDPSIRSHKNAGTFRDLAFDGPQIVAACQCDSITRGDQTKQTKALVKVNGSTGAVSDWGPTELRATSAAMGRSVLVDGGSVYAAIGGSDFVARYDLTTGDPLWKTDTNGSSQALTFLGSDLIVGGHFRWVEGPGTGGGCSQGTQCVYQPKLISLNPSNGALAYHTQSTSVGDRNLADWDPAFCCQYNGVWTLLVDNQDDLWVGGQFTKVGTAWDPDRMFQGMVPRALNTVQQQCIAQLG
jgi:hypothetical protein